MKSWDYDDLPQAILEKPDFQDMAHFFHVPVLLEEVTALLRPAPGMLILDGTAGGGGHTERMLEHGADVIALDQDAEAVEACRERLARFGARFRIAESNFADAGTTLTALGVPSVAGALLDLGVSSHQLDTAQRGFAMMKDGPLDMRMSRQAGLTAADIVNTWAVADMARIFREYGEEPRAMHVAARLATLRQKHRFETTFDLAAAVSSVIPRTSGRHPATKIFQALRIAVNDELGSLRRGLKEISARLAHGGRFAVITFHSLEDRIVKHYFRDRSQEWIDRPEWPEPRKNPDRLFRLLTSRPVDAGTEELQSNPRARSAKLRVVERL